MPFLMFLVINPLHESIKVPVPLCRYYVVIDKNEASNDLQVSKLRFQSATGL